MWLWPAGAPLSLSTAPSEGYAQELRLGDDITDGERPQGGVPPGHWQSSRSLGAWTLVSCTVAPGFLFETFELAAEGFAPPRR